MHASHVVVLVHYLYCKARLNIVNTSVSVVCSVANAGLSVST